MIWKFKVIDQLVVTYLVVTGSSPAPAKPPCLLACLQNQLHLFCSNHSLSCDKIFSFLLAWLLALLVILFYAIIWPSTRLYWGCLRVCEHRGGCMAKLLLCCCFERYFILLISSYWLARCSILLFISFPWLKLWSRITELADCFDILTELENPFQNFILLPWEIPKSLPSCIEFEILTLYVDNAYDYHSNLDLVCVHWAS